MTTALGTAMRLTAFLLIAALLLKSVAGFAMAGCHAGHHPAEPVGSWAALENLGQLAGTIPATDLFIASDSNPAEPKLQPNTSTFCSLCASCCVTTTPPLDTASNHLPLFPELIQSPDFVDLSVYPTLASQPPRQA
ncbi:MAG: hypothetical protein LAT66_10200 [Alkalimonas sp.]|nr:hypothetical protein [Alkalimonas sp.]